MDCASRLTIFPVGLLMLLWLLPAWAQAVTLSPSSAYNSLIINEINVKDDYVELLALAPVDLTGTQWSLRFSSQKNKIQPDWQINFGGLFIPEGSYVVIAKGLDSSELPQGTLLLNDQDVRLKQSGQLAVVNTTAPWQSQSPWLVGPSLVYANNPNNEKRPWTLSPSTAVKTVYATGSKDKSSLCGKPTGLDEWGPCESTVGAPNVPRRQLTLLWMREIRP